MRKRAVILDLDNTIYPVRSIADEFFPPLFELIHKDGTHEDQFDQIKKEIMRRPFQLVAKEFAFSNELIEQGMNFLKGATYLGKIKAFDDYAEVKKLNIDKFLVTTGFVQLQQSKITGMKIQNDFKEIHIVDPTQVTQTKKDVFADIMSRHHYDKSEVLVVGDDPKSEIKAAQDLGIDVVLYDKEGLYKNLNGIKRINDYKDLALEI